jgi:hypothetical protein
LALSFYYAAFFFLEGWLARCLNTILCDNVVAFSFCMVFCFHVFFL